MTQHKGTICIDFTEKAQQCWRWLYNSHLVGIPISEESLTDYVLVNLAKSNPLNIRTEKYTKPRENQVGADWEWWLGEGTQWVGLRVQAKKLNARTLDYPKLAETDRKGRRQIDVLITEATKEKRKRIPLYVFYNSWDVFRVKPTWNCKRHHFEWLGCSIEHAQAVRRVLDSGSNALADLMPEMYPWSCLVCCTRHAVGNRLPEVTAGFLSVAFGDLPDAGRPQEFITEDPPEYVIRLAEGQPLGVDQWESIRVNTVSVIHL